MNGEAAQSTSTPAATIDSKSPNNYDDEDKMRSTEEGQSQMSDFPFTTSEQKEKFEDDLFDKNPDTMPKKSRFISFKSAISFDHGTFDLENTLADRIEDMMPR